MSRVYSQELVLLLQCLNKCYMNEICLGRHCAIPGCPTFVLPFKLNKFNSLKLIKYCNSDSTCVNCGLLRHNECDFGISWDKISRIRRY